MNKFCNTEYSVFQIGNKKVAAELDEAYASLEKHIRSKELLPTDSVYRMIAIFYNQLGWNFKNPPIGKFVCQGYNEKQQRTNFFLEDFAENAAEDNSVFPLDLKTTWKMPDLPLTTGAIEKKKLKLESKAA